MFYHVSMHFIFLIYRLIVVYERRRVYLASCVGDDMIAFHLFYTFFKNATVCYLYIFTVILIYVQLILYKKLNKCLLFTDFFRA